jgi:hypothetical protein
MILCPKLGETVFLAIRIFLIDYRIPFIPYLCRKTKRGIEYKMDTCRSPNYAFYPCLGHIFMRNSSIIAPGSKPI